MRKIREVLRLHHAAGLSIRAIARSLGVSPSTVGEYVRRAQGQGLSWPLPESLDDAALIQRLYPTRAPSGTRFRWETTTTLRRERWDDSEHVHPLPADSAQEGCSPNICSSTQPLTQEFQFTCEAFTDVFKDHAIAISMDGKGRWVDNVFVERLWRSVKYEEVYLRAYDTPPELRASAVPECSSMAGLKMSSSSMASSSSPH